jgi:hypothetical protein
VIDSGAGVKKSQYSSTGFLRRTSGIRLTADGEYFGETIALGGKKVEPRFATSRPDFLSEP